MRTEKEPYYHFEPWGIKKEAIQFRIAELADEMPKPQLLDNVGIKLDLKTLPCYPEYTAARAALFGRGRLHRFWMRYVFPHIRPREHARRREAFERVQAQLRREFMNAIMDE